MAYAEDLKSSGAKAPCGFESRSRHHYFGVCVANYWFSRESAIRNTPVLSHLNQVNP